MQNTIYILSVNVDSDANADMLWWRFANCLFPSTLEPGH